MLARYVLMAIKPSSQARVAIKMATKAVPASISARLKAFIIDLFLISVPILYFTTYIILNGKNDFLQNQLAIFIVWLAFGIIQSAFFAFKGASPGYKAQGIYAVSLQGKKANFFCYFLRYICFITLFIIGGSFFCFFSKNKRNLHDIISKTIVVRSV